MNRTGTAAKDVTTVIDLTVSKLSATIKPVATIPRHAAQTRRLTFPGSWSPGKFLVQIPANT